MTADVIMPSTDPMQRLEALGKIGCDRNGAAHSLSAAMHQGRIQ
jgi:hypothetical protein